MVLPTPAPPAATATPVPLPAAPTSAVDPFVGRLFVPIALIVGLVLAGFLLAKVRGRSAQGALADGDGSGLEPELYSALADPVAPFLEPVRRAAHDASRAGPVPYPDAEDPWANAPTIAVHVEQIDPTEDEPGR